MTETIFEQTIVVSAGAMKLALAAERDFKAARRHGRHKLHYMTHADGWLMVRRDGVTPFTISEREWRGLQPWTDIKGASE